MRRRVYLSIDRNTSAFRLQQSVNNNPSLSFPQLAQPGALRVYRILGDILHHPI